MKRKSIHSGFSLLAATAALIGAGWSMQAADPESSPATAGQQAKKPNIVILMTDDTGWGDFGYISGGGAWLGHATPNIDRIAKEGTHFTSWYGQASCTAGRCSFITGRIPIRSAMSVVVVPGDRNGLRKETPTIAEFFKKNDYRTYFSGKWHLGDVPEFYPIEHGFDEMKHFGAYYPGVYTYADTSNDFHPWFPSYNKQFAEEYFKIVNMYEWEGVAGEPAKKGPYITWDYLSEYRCPSDEFCRCIHQEARQGRQAVLHGHQLYEDAQPEQPRQGVSWEVTSREIFGCDAGTRRQHRPDHGCDPG